MTRRLYINANCQGPALKAMLSEVLPDWTIMALAVHEEHDPALVRQAEQFMRSADIVITQPISDEWGVPAFRTSRVREAAGSPDRLIVFPSIYFQGQLLTLHPLKVNGVKVQTPGWAYTDGLVAFLIAAGEPVDRIVDLMGSCDLFAKGVVEARIDDFMDVNREIEVSGGCDIIVTDLFRDHICDRQLLHSFNHPTRFVMAEVCNRILSHMGERRRVAEAGEDHLQFPHFPISPGVARHLGDLAGAISHDFHWRTRSFNHVEYIKLMSMILMDVDRDLLRQATCGDAKFWSFLSAWRETTPLRDRLSDGVLAIEPVRVGEPK
jgi:hypothetical protein